jgi:mono/diheme cytochrome c family protein
MRDQPRYETFEASTFFADGQSARPLVTGTIARGRLPDNEAIAAGRTGGEFVTEPPVELTAALVERGRNRFNIYCSPCHAFTGNGDGMIVQRGFRRPPSFHVERLRQAPAGHFFDVMTHGLGAMPSYAAQLDPRDRWAVVGYLRALQLSQNATAEGVPRSERASLEVQP